MKPRFAKIIILDDSSFDTSLSILLFKRMLPGMDIDIRGFTDPREGLHYLQTEFGCDVADTLLLLDISMPYLDGWQVLHQLEQLQPDILRCLTVFIVSYSVSQPNVQKSEASPLVKAYLAKPLTDHIGYLLGYMEDQQDGNINSVNHLLRKEEK